MKWKRAMGAMLCAVIAMMVVCCSAQYVDARDYIVIEQVAGQSAQYATPVQMNQMQGTQVVEVRHERVKHKHRHGHAVSVSMPVSNSASYMRTSNSGITNVTASTCACGPNCPYKTNASHTPQKPTDYGVYTAPQPQVN